MLGQCYDVLINIPLLSIHHSFFHIVCLYLVWNQKYFFCVECWEKEIEIINCIIEVLVIQIDVSITKNNTMSFLYFCCCYLFVCCLFAFVKHIVQLSILILDMCNNSSKSNPQWCECEFSLPCQVVVNEAEVFLLCWKMPLVCANYRFDQHTTEQQHQQRKEFK